MYSTSILNKKTIEILKTLYKNSKNNHFLNISNIINLFGIESYATILSLTFEGYVNLHFSDGYIIGTHNFSEKFISLSSEIDYYTQKNFTIHILSAGEKVVEDHRNKTISFYAPLAISILSFIISFATLFFNLIDKSPILVKLITM